MSRHNDALDPYIWMHEQGYINLILQIRRIERLEARDPAELVICLPYDYPAIWESPTMILGIPVSS